MHSVRLLDTLEYLVYEICIKIILIYLALGHLMEILGPIMYPNAGTAI